MKRTRTVARQGKAHLKARFAGPAQASRRVGRIEIPVKINGFSKTLIVCLQLSRVDEHIASIERSRVSAKEIIRLRRTRR